GADFVRSERELEIDPVRAGAVGFPTPERLIDLPRVFIVVIARPKAETEVDLLEIVHAGDALGFGFGATERRQQHAGEDGDDRDDDEEFDQGEGARVLRGLAAFTSEP